MISNSRGILIAVTVDNPVFAAIMMHTLVPTAEAVGCVWKYTWVGGGL